MHAPASLEALGWTPALEREFTAVPRDGAIPARVVAQHRGACIVASEGAELVAEPSGRLRHEEQSAADAAAVPTVGDWVAVRPLEGDRGRIEAVLPRRGAFSRKVAGFETREQVIAANVDVAFLVSAAPDVNPRRLERALTLAWEGGAEPVCVLTKADLVVDVARAVLAVEAVAIGVPVLAVSNLTGAGIEDVRRHLAGNRTAALIGASGAGKSSLANRLLGRELLAVAAVRADGRGRHTTTHRELVALPGGGLVLDTPGLREIALWEASEGVRTTFADVEELAERCRFADCRHDGEPGCAVEEAIRTGALAAERLAGYRKLERELAALERRRDPLLARAERSRWRAVNRENRKRARQRSGRRKS